MGARVIKGAPVAARRQRSSDGVFMVTAEVRRSGTAATKPRLQVLLAGDDPGSHWYAASKVKLGGKLGIQVEIQELFKQILVLAKALGTLRMGRVSLDGTKVQGNASKHKASWSSSWRGRYRPCWSWRSERTRRGGRNSRSWTSRKNYSGGRSGCFGKHRRRSSGRRSGMRRSKRSTKRS